MSSDVSESLRTASAYATADVPTASPADRVDHVRERLVRGTYAAAQDAVVLADGRVVGLLPLEVLLHADPEERRVGKSVDQV